MSEPITVTFGAVKAWVGIKPPEDTVAMSSCTACLIAKYLLDLTGADEVSVLFAHADIVRGTIPGQRKFTSAHIEPKLQEFLAETYGIGPDLHPFAIGKPATLGAVLDTMTAYDNKA